MTHIKLVRRRAAINDVAVKPVTQFPTTWPEPISEEQYRSSYPNVRKVVIKKENQSLGIMIIEGKHAEVGQGIFISDVQETSLADKAGLEIGEMILAVDKESFVGSSYNNAATFLRRTKGLVTLIVSNPGKKDQGPAIDATIINNVCQNSNEKSIVNHQLTEVVKAKAPTLRPTSPLPEQVADITTCPIIVGKNSNIEINTDNKGLGMFIAGGKDTQMPNGIVVIEVYAGGMADRDGRLMSGDEILEINGTTLKNLTHIAALQLIRQTLPKIKLVVFRPEKNQFTQLDVDLVKRAGKGLGLSIISKKSCKGIYVTDIINGGPAEMDGRIMKGDLIASVNGQVMENFSAEEACAILKTAAGKTSLKIYRYKPCQK